MIRYCFNEGSFESLGGDMVDKKTSNPRNAFQEAARRIVGDDGIEVSADEHIA